LDSFVHGIGSFRIFPLAEKRCAVPFLETDENGHRFRLWGHVNN
jgi:hypothetical protein